MAFEVPLEADRIDDDLNLLSTIARAPVIGTLFWFLGGKGGEEDDDDMKRSFSKGAGMKKAAPSLVGSEVSEIGEIRDSLDAMCLENDSPFRHRKKELSWSDETGKSLVQIIDESTVPAHEPNPREAPVRSAMSRSRSVRCGADRLEQDSVKVPPSQQQQPQQQQQPSYPLVDPFSSGTSGIDSPQWGWYINTTPPTPEMYYSRPQKTRKPDSSSDTSEASTITMPPPDGNDALTFPKYHPNPIFRGLQDKDRSVPMDWPSVPL